MRVWGWQGSRLEAREHPDGKPWTNQTREIMAAPSMAAVARAAPYVTRSRQLFNLCETGNEQEMETAMKEPGTIFWQPLNSRSANWVKA